MSGANFWSDYRLIRVSFRKMGKGGGAKQCLQKHGGDKGSARISVPSRGYGGILNLYPNRCIFRLICGSQMT